MNIVIRDARVPGMGRVDVQIDGGRIVSIADHLDDSSGDVTVAADGLWLVPGWIDLQINDIEWLARGLQSATAHASRIREVAEYQARRGVTGFILATLAAPIDEITEYLRGMREVLQSMASPFDAAFLGGLVEGTFMNPEFHGAHNPRFVMPPDEALLDQLLETEAVRLINIAPEMSSDAIDLIRRASERGVVVGCGHAKPHAECVREAVAAGLRYVIHLGNGPTGSNLKAFRGGGLLEETLRNDDLVATIILDGFHVHPALVRDWIVRKTVERIVGVSDAGFALGPPKEDFEVFGIRGAVAEGDDGAEYLYVRSPAANERSSDAMSLFGSAIDQRRTFENALNWLSAPMEGVSHRKHEALDFEAALEAAIAITSTNPADLIGESERGRIVSGARADLLLLDITEEAGTHAVSVERVFLNGQEITS